MLSIGLKKGTGSSNVFKKPAAPAAKSKAQTFGDDEDDEQSRFPVASTSKAPIPPKANVALSRAQKQRIAEAEQLDSSVYEYDEVYDHMKAGERAVEEARKKESQERKPRYISGLLQTAEVRKQDRIRAEDKMTAREREKEGSEFADKDAFVTPAYLAQQEELRKAEEEEKRKEELAAKTRGSGMASFYAQYLANDAARNEAAQKAVADKAAGVSSAEPQYDEEPVSDVQLAKEAAAKLGRVVQVNEDGQVVDKTELLSGGLNVIAPKKRKVQGPTMPSEGDQGGFSVPISQRQAAAKKSEKEEKKPDQPLYDMERRRAMRERQSKELQTQMIEAEEKKRKLEDEEAAKHVQKLAKRNDESKVAELKRLAAERRAQREVK